MTSFIMSGIALVVIMTILITSPLVSGQTYTGVVSQDYVGMSTGTRTWSVNTVASYAVGYRVQITWESDTSQNMVGTITAVSSSANTITVNVDTVNGETGIPWSPWDFSLISIPSSTVAPAVSSSPRSSSVSSSAAAAVSSSAPAPVSSSAAAAVSSSARSSSLVSSSVLASTAAAPVSSSIRSSSVPSSSPTPTPISSSVIPTPISSSVNPTQISSTVASTAAPVASSSASIPSSTGPSYAGVVATNNVAQSTGVRTWNVNFVASFGVGDRVRISWVTNPSDNMIGNITAVDRVGNTITVNVDTVNGQTGIAWSPWSFTLIAAANPVLPVTTLSSSASSAPAVTISSSAAPASYTGVEATNNVPLTSGLSTWNVNMVASFAPGDRVMIAWTGDLDDNMIGNIVSVDPVGLTITVNVDTVNGQTGIAWSPWTFTLVSVAGQTSSTGNSALSMNSPLQPLLMSAIGLIALSTSALLFV